MYSRYIVAIALLTLILFLFISMPALAQDDTRFSHTIDMKIGGAITLDREIGDPSTSGTVKRQRIRGFGDLTKRETFRIAQNIITVEETSDWTVSPLALSGLSVTTIIELLHKPMSAAEQTYRIDADTVIEIGDIINPYHPLVVEGKILVSALTAQVWATALLTNPGHSGGYHSTFDAAYGPGPYEKLYGAVDQWGNPFFYDSEYMWEFDPAVNPIYRDDRTYGYKRGKYYVGNYFNIEQYAHTSDGFLKRFISISSPFENTILIEDLSVDGMASIREAFKMHNLKRGPQGLTLAWYELF